MDSGADAGNWTCTDALLFTLHRALNIEAESGEKAPALGTEGRGCTYLTESVPISVNQLYEMKLLQQSRRRSFQGSPGWSSHLPSGERELVSNSN